MPVKTKKQHTTPQQKPEDKTLDLSLRPKTWADYVGQERIKNNLKVILEAAKKRGQSPDHLLFYGGSGLGKTTLAYLVAKEMQADIRITTGPAIEKAGDLAAILTNLSDGDVLFIDELHRLNKLTEEIIYPAMEDFKLHIILGKGPMARTMELDLSRFTLIGATIRIALLSAPLRNRFGATFQLNYYNTAEMKEIIQRSSKVLEIEIEPDAAQIIAERCRFTPRVANRLLKRVRDFAQVARKDTITKQIAETALTALEVDELGLELADRKILKAIIEKFDGGPVGLQTLSASSLEEQDTILDVYEPYLMQIGFIERTPRGRMATKLAYQHLGIEYKDPQAMLL